MRPDPARLVGTAMAALALAGCAHRSTPKNDREGAPQPPAAAALPGNPPNDFASFPIDGVYPLYCLKLGATNRARVFSVSPKDNDGWPTKHPVELYAGTHHSSSSCRPENAISNGDRLEIVKSSTGGFVMKLTHDRKVIEQDLNPPPGLEPVFFPMWYQTSDKGYPVQYFVYFADESNGLGEKKQKYYIEAFLLSADADCLKERPDLSRGNVVSVTTKYDCVIPGFQENGTGTGEEPK